MRENKKKVVFESVTRTTDKLTGEVLSETTERVSRLPQEPEYIKMYLQDLCHLTNLPAGLMDTLFILLKKLDYSGFITLSSRFRNEVCEELGIKSQTFRNRLNALAKANILKHISTNEYQANPHYFGRGDWASIYERRSSFEVTITYTPSGGRAVQMRKQQEQQELPLALVS